MRLPLPSGTVKNRSANSSNRSAQAGQTPGQGGGGTTSHTHSHREDENDLQYSVVDTPPSYLCLALGFQVCVISQHVKITVEDNNDINVQQPCM